MEFFENFGLRELVIGTAVLLGIYSGIVIIRLARMSRTSPPEPVWKQAPTQFGEQVMKPASKRNWPSCVVKSPR
ncbi:MAG: hypothetical protein M5R42_07310 [Rhodocyclaceae bacterium]|nr:hypothetical protein [Rhodocyclaceae bacterium]